MQTPSFNIPTIERLPDNISNAGRFLWEEQDKLNAVMHPNGIGTLQAGRTLGRAQLEELVFDYQLALLSEANENLDNFIWKHWAKETKEGRRFQLVHTNGDAGEGTKQNVMVEIADQAFFTISLLHLLGYSVDDWIRVWADQSIWENARGDASNPTDAKRLIKNTLRLVALANQMPFANQGESAQKLGQEIMRAYVEICALSGMTWQSALNVYAQKLIKNYERTLRGRKQVGDQLAEAENAGIRA